MKKKLYICYTHFQLLITIIKVLKNKNKDKIDVMLCSDNTNDVLINDINLINEIKEKKIFNNTIIFDYHEEQLRMSNSKFEYLKKIFFINKIKKEYSSILKKYDDIYTFNDVLVLGRVLNYKNIKYHLIEDGTDCFKNNKKIIANRGIKTFIKKYFFNMKTMGESKNIIDIEVNDKNDIMIKNQKIVEVPRKEMFDNLTEKEQELIQKIFISQKIIDKLNGSILIITQPLSEDKILTSDIKKVNIYKKIIQNYCNNEQVVIKTHPRETTNYNEYFKDCIIVDKIFPIEIINFNKKIWFNKIITVSSTSINLIENCNEKIYLGWDYLKKVK